MTFDSGDVSFASFIEMQVRLKSLEAEHKLVVDALHDSIDRLNEAQHISHVGSWTLDLLSSKLIWSDEVFRLFEIDPKQFGANYEAFLNSIHPEDRDAVSKAYTDSLSNQEPYEITHRLLMADGRIKWVRERCDSEFDVTGKPLRSIGTVQDVTEQRMNEDALRQAKKKIESIVNNIPAMVFLKRASDLRFELFNLAGEELLGHSSEDMLGKNDYDFFPKEQADFFTAQDRRVLASKDVIEIPEEKITTASGETRYLYTRKTAICDLAGEPSHLLGVSLDITERKRAETDLRIAAVAFESQEGMVITNASGIILRVNQAFTKTTGYTAEEAVGQTPSLLQSGRHNADFYLAMWETINEKGVWQGEVWDRHKNGDVYPKWLTISAVKDDDGVVTHYVGAHYDITERKQLEEQVHHLAFHDALTRLPNRRLIKDRLSQAMAASKRSGCYGAFMFLDLDNFKPLNDTHGHVVGDLLLIEAAGRLKSCVRKIDTVARFGGDEFVVILTELNMDNAVSNSQAMLVAEKIRNTLSEPYLLAIKYEGKEDSTIEHQCSVSIGVTMFFNHETSQDDILKCADKAMYQAKQAGRNTIRFYVL